MAVIGYPIEERLRWPVITASPRRQCSKLIQNLEGKAYSDEGKPCQSPGRMKNSSYYIAPAGDRTHYLPHTVASNMGKVSHALRGRSQLSTFMKAYRAYARGEGVWDHRTLFLRKSTFILITDNVFSNTAHV